MSESTNRDDSQDLHPPELRSVPNAGLEMLVETSPHLFWSGGPDGTLDYFNQRCLDYFQRTYQEMKDHGWRNVLHSDDVPNCLKHWNYSLETGEPYEIEFRLKRASDNTYRWHLARALPQRSPDGRILRWFGSCTDIHDKKEAEAKLKRTQEELEQRVQERTHELEEANRLLEKEMEARDGILNSVAAHIALLDESGSILAVNEAWKRFGQENLLQSPEYGVGTNYLAVCKNAKGLTAEEAPAVAKGIRSVLSGESEAFSLEYPCHASHCNRWFRLMVSPLSKSDLRGAVVMHINITEEKQARIAILKERNLSDQLVNSLPGVFYLFNKQGRFLRWNRNFELVTGYGEEEFREMHCLDFFREPHRTRALHAMSRVFEVGHVEFEADFTTRNGDTIPFLLTGRRMVFDDQPCLIGMGIDITERVKADEAMRLSEERYRILVETARDAIFMLSPEGTITSLNSAFQQITGWRMKDWIGRHFIGIIQPEDQPLAMQTFQEVLEGDTPAHFELRVLAREGDAVPMEFTVTPKRTGDTIDGVLGIARDVRDRRVLEDQLRQAQKLEAIGQLAGGIAHDFNNILGAIIGNAELARMDLEAEHPAAFSLREISQASQRAKELIQQILAFSRKQSGERRWIDVRTVVQEAATLLRATLPAGIQLTVHDQIAVPKIHADPTQLHQILMNLATNAWHALEDQPGRIDIRVEPWRQEETALRYRSDLKSGSFVAIAVSDTGSGMPPAVLERVFEPFFTTKSVGKGTGLGLSVAHGIMRAHGGHIDAESTPGMGTTFRIYFPVPEEGSSMEESPAAESASFPDGQGRHVLCLDDEQPLLRSTKRLLERLGYRVTECTRTDEALAALRNAPGDFDLVLTDYNMPERSGIWVAAEIGRRCPELPVVLTSGYITDELRDRAEAAGVRHILHKPVSVGELALIAHRLTEPKLR